MVRVQMKGRRYGRLLVIEEDPNRGNFNKIRWSCQCDCGKTLSVNGDALRSGNTKSCGCLMVEVVKVSGNKNKTHGMTRSPEYRTWCSMKTRCYKEDYPSYPNYGGRGIKVCDRWLESFENFFSDMGKRPANASLDRIDNSKGYDPDNCRWATTIEQANNKRNNNLHLFRGSLVSLSRIAAITGISQPTLWSRLNRMKLTIDEAVELTLKGRRDVWS